jgi:hypothetical protein
MFIALRLLLAHLIGDFPLQSGKVYSLKVKNALGKAIHAGIVTLMMIALSWPFLTQPWMWLILAVNGVGHFLQDWLKLYIARRISNPNNFFLFILDQALHVLSAFLVLWTPLAHAVSASDNSFFLSRFYFDNTSVSLLICLLTVSFAGTFTIATFKATFFPKDWATPFLEPLERTYGNTERILMFSCFFFSPWLGFIFPLFLIPRFLFANFQIKRLQGSSHAGFLADSILGMALSFAVYFCIWKILV